MSLYTHPAAPARTAAAKRVDSVTLVTTSTRAGFVALSATNRSRDRRPCSTPSEKTTGRQVSRPGIPFGIFVKGASVP